MTDNPDHTQEMLRRMRSEQNERFDRLDSAIAEVQTLLRIHGAHIAGLVQQENFTGGKVAEIESRLARVEKRLDLVDPTIPD
jgi:septal ring factor EnvC (AmiA/AmiB activator)